MYEGGDGGAAAAAGPEERVTAVLGWALAELCNPPPPAQEIAALAADVVACMSGPRRRFHTVPHALKLAHGAGPVQTVAALYHDCVYVQVDQGFPPPARALKRHFKGLHDQGKHTKRLVAGTDGGLTKVLLDIAKDVFGFHYGDELTPFGGLNEFASAVFMARALERHVNLKLLTQIIVAIEATRPFRENMGPRLHARLESANLSFGLGFDPPELAATVQQAVELSNRDLGDFGHLDFAWFISGSWELLPEGTPELGGRGSALPHWRTATYKMHKFLSNLEPGRVFNSFQGLPEADSMAELLARCTHNLACADSYLLAKTLEALFLEAVLVLNEGPAAMAEVRERFVLGFAKTSLSKARGGDPRDTDLTWEQLSATLVGACQKLAGKAYWNAEPLNKTVYRTLVHGRALAVDWDVRVSPVAAVIYGHVGEEGLRRLQRGFEPLLRAAMTRSVNKEEAAAVLEAFPPLISDSLCNLLLEILDIKQTGPPSPEKKAELTETWDLYTF